MRDGRFGEGVFSQRLANDQAAIEKLVARPARAGTEVRWAIDLTSNAAALLVATEAPMVYVPGRVVNRMTGVFRVRPNLTPRMAE